MSRSTEINRKTSETDISLTLNLDGKGEARIDTGVAFFDHMVNAVAKHGKLDLQLTCKGDVEIDDHHSVEDCALALGSAVDQILEDRRGIKRFGSAYAPLDEALARVVIDLSGRPHCCVDLSLEREMLGELSSENVPHFFQSFATTARAAVHVDVIKGENDHHKAEAAFKAFALALREAISLDGTNDVPSTKGSL